MKGPLIFRIFVDISLYPQEFFALRDFIIHSLDFTTLEKCDMVNMSLRLG